jgi:uncharacterized OsmC-like protein
MVKMNVVYTGQKHCELEHLSSKSKIETDAPKDNQGKGERFSPTDLVGAALGSCILTTIALVAERGGVSIEGAKAEVEKVMTATPPRRIESLKVHITMSAALSAADRRKFEETAKHCPVHHSLHPDVQIPLSFSYV